MAAPQAGPSPVPDLLAHFAAAPRAPGVGLPWAQVLTAQVRGRQRDVNAPVCVVDIGAPDFVHLEYLAELLVPTTRLLRLFTCGPRFHLGDEFAWHHDPASGAGLCAAAMTPDRLCPPGSFPALRAAVGRLSRLSGCAVEVHVFGTSDRLLGALGAQEPHLVTCFHTQLTPTSEQQFDVVLTHTYRGRPAAMVLRPHSLIVAEAHDPPWALSLRTHPFFALAEGFQRALRVHGLTFDGTLRLFNDPVGALLRIRAYFPQTPMATWDGAAGDGCVHGPGQIEGLWQLWSRGMQRVLSSAHPGPR